MSTVLLEWLQETHKYHVKLLTVVSYRSQIASNVFIVDFSQSSDPLLTWAQITVNNLNKYYSSDHFKLENMSVLYKISFIFM
jgi:hypothetical protein